MAIKSKIGSIWDEIKRIGAYSPEVFKPGLDVSWNYSDMVVRGKRVESFPFELLLEVFKTIPDGAGEDAFWKAVDATDFDAHYERLTNEMLLAWKKEDQLARRRLSRKSGKKKTASKKTARVKRTSSAKGKNK